MRFGLHVRVGTGYDDAVAYAQRLGCTALQGYAFARPMSSQDLMEFMQARARNLEAPDRHSIRA